MYPSPQFSDIIIGPLKGHRPEGQLGGSVI